MEQTTDVSELNERLLEWRARAFAAERELEALRGKLGKAKNAFLDFECQLETARKAVHNSQYWGDEESYEGGMTWERLLDDRSAKVYLALKVE